MSKCPKCGCQCEDGAKFCDECGTPIPQEKECPKCHAHLGLSAKFCDECGFSFENVGGKPSTISMGDKNVVAGDVVAHKESYDIKGNATIVRNEDESKKMVQCSDCGKNIPVSQSFECPSCHRIVCEECFDAASQKCKKCIGEKASAKEEAYRAAIVEALSDGKIDVADRKKLMGLQKQLGISAVRAIQIEKELKSASTETGGSKNAAALDKVNVEKAYELLYVKGDYKKAAELLSPIRERNPNDENVLDLYLAALAKFNPVKARNVIEDLHADVLSGALALIDIDLKRKDLASVEKRLAAAFAVWPDSVLLKCRKAVYAYEMFKATEDSAPLMEAMEVLESISDCKDAVEKSWKFFAKRLIDSALGESLDLVTADDCLSKGLLWDIVSQNEDKSNALYRIIDVSDGPSAKFYPTYYMDTESIFDWPDEFKTSLLALRRIDPGRFVMGKGPREVEDDSDTNPHPAHVVTLTRAYYIGVFTVSQRQWELITGKRPSRFSRDDCYAKRPVENFDYEELRGKSAGSKWPLSRGVDSNSFIGVLRKKTGIADFDLPTEAQWEYACRAGTSTDFNDGKDILEDSGEAIEAISKIARFNSDLGDLSCEDVGTDVGTAEIGSYKPNKWGLYDMHGNVTEFCVDANSPDNETIPFDMPQVDPVGFSGNQNETIEDVGHGCARGGDWSSAEPDVATSWAKAYGVQDGGVRLAIATNKMDADVEKWTDVPADEIRSIPKEVYDKFVNLSAQGDLAARLIVTKAQYYGTLFAAAMKENALKMCEEMSGIGYGPAQTFLGVLAVDSNRIETAVKYFKESALGGDAKGSLLLRQLLRGDDAFKNKLSAYLHSIDMDYVCVDDKLKRLLPKFKELAQKYFGVEANAFPANILGAFADEGFLGEDEGNDSFVLFADDGIYLIHGWGWSRFNKVLTWEDVVLHGEVKKHYSTIQLCATPFAMTWGAWQNDEDADVFAKIIAIAKESYKPSLQKKTGSDATAGNTTEQKYSYSLTLRGGEVGVYRREYEDQEELDECLDCARNWDHAGGDGIHGLMVSRSGIHVEVKDGQGNVVFETDIKKDDLTNGTGKLRIESRGNYFNEGASATQGKKFYYSCIEWHRYVWKVELELNAPFDSQKLSLFSHVYVDSSGNERMFIGEESAQYDEKSITDIAQSVDEEPSGDDEMDVWTLVDGTRTKLDVYENEDDEDEEEEDADAADEESDGDGECDDEGPDSEEEDIEEEEEESDEGEETDDEEVDTEDDADVAKNNNGKSDDDDSDKSKVGNGAEDGKIAVTSAEPTFETPTFETDEELKDNGIGLPSSHSDKKRLVFLLIGILLGFIGLHFKYARRKVLFHLTWLTLVGFITCMSMKCAGLGGLFSILWLILWFGGAIFVKKDGKKNIMKWF